MTITSLLRTVVMTAVLICSSLANSAEIKALDIPAGDLTAALEALARQSSIELVYRSDEIRGLKTRGVRGNFSPQDAVARLISGTKLTITTDAAGAILISSARPPVKTTADPAQAADLRVAQSGKSENPENLQKVEEQTFPSQTGEASQQGVPEILVKGSKILNMDIRRTRDDAQPYVVFERETIERSGSPNLEEFLKTRLTMNTLGQQNSTINATIGSVGQVNLRGLGTNQTLILIDGRKVPNFTQIGSQLQPDLNSVPLAAIERIEILPSTASGIYGGGATGGAINIIMRRDYVGTEVKLTYDNTFHASAAGRRIDASGGLSLEDGRTQLLLAASHSDRDVLTNGERPIIQRRRMETFARFPQFFFSRGSPPFGATPNIVSISGNNLVLKGGIPLNSPFTHIPAGYRSVALDGTAALRANAGKYNLELAPTPQLFVGALQGLKNGPKSDSVSITVRREFTDALQMFLEVSGSDTLSRFPTGPFSLYTLPASAPNNPFTESIAVFPSLPGYGADILSRSGVRRMAGGAVIKLPRNWNVATDYTWGSTRFAFTGTPAVSTAGTAAIQAGTLDVMRDTAAYPLDLSAYLLPGQSTRKPFISVLKSATVRFAGPTLSLPGGTLKALLALERQEQDIQEAWQYVIGGSFATASTLVYPARSQAVDSAYLELTAPLIGAVELAVAARFDSYTTKGVTNSYTLESPPASLIHTTNKLQSINPTVSLSYQPMSGIHMRASYGTGFLPPAVNQTVPTPALNTVSIIDARRGNTTTVLPVGSYLSGGNPGLRPEESESWSAGLVFTPPQIEGLRLSVDYTRIGKTDNILTPTVAQILTNEAVFPGRVTRAAVAPGDPYGVGVLTALNVTLVNVAKARVEAFDFSLEYRLRTATLGEWTLFGAATRQTHYQTQLLPGLPVVENVGISRTSTVPLKFKANGGIGWELGPWTANWNATYFHSYYQADPTLATSALVLAVQGNGGKVPTQTFHDLVIGYRFPLREGSSSWLARLSSGVEVQAGIRNVFDKAPAFSVTNLNGNFFSELGDTRGASYDLSIKRTF